MGIRVEKPVLHGSYTKGNIHAGSDLDLAFVPPDFAKDRFDVGKMLAFKTPHTSAGRKKRS
jgi:predicted nucleotidyltransferase